MSPKELLTLLLSGGSSLAPGGFFSCRADSTLPKAQGDPAADPPPLSLLLSPLLYAAGQI